MVRHSSPHPSTRISSPPQRAGPTAFIEDEGHRNAGIPWKGRWFHPVRALLRPGTPQGHGLADARQGHDLTPESGCTRIPSTSQFIAPSTNVRGNTSVGQPQPPAWQANHNYGSGVVGTQVVHDNYLFTCVAAVSPYTSGSTGPTTPTDGIVDGNLTWNYAPQTFTVQDNHGSLHSVTSTGTGSGTLLNCYCADETSATLETNNFVGGFNYRTFQTVLRVSDFYFAGAALFWGFGDSVTFINGHLAWDFTNAPTNTGVLGDGLPLGLFNSADNLQVTDITGFGTGTNAKRQAMVVGTGVIQIRDCAFGQNDTLPLIRARSLLNTYQGAAPAAVPLSTGSNLAFYVDGCSLVNIFGAFWIEIYEQIPNQVTLRNVNNLGGEFLWESFGIWLDQGVALPTSANDIRANIFQYDMPRGETVVQNGTPFTVYQGWDPGASAAPSYLQAVDVTSAFVTLMQLTGLPDAAPSGQAFEKNLFLGTSTDNTSFFGVVGGTSAGQDTTTGIALTGYNGGTSWNATFAHNQIGLDSQAMPAGVYTFSCFLKVNYAVEVIAQIGPTGANTQSASRRLEAADSFQRIEIPFWYPGNGASLQVAVFGPVAPAQPAWASGTYYAGQLVVNTTTRNVYVCTNGTPGSPVSSTVVPTGTGSQINPGGGAIWNYVGPYSGAGTSFTPYTNIGLWMVNKGSRAAPYSFSQAADSAAVVGWVPRTYFGTAAPTQTTTAFFVGDICWNTAPASNGIMGWVCVSSSASYGGAGLWQPFGHIGPTITGANLEAYNQTGNSITISSAASGAPPTIAVSGVSPEPLKLVGNNSAVNGFGVILDNATAATSGDVFDFRSGSQEIASMSWKGDMNLGQAGAVTNQTEALTLNSGNGTTAFASTVTSQTNGALTLKGDVTAGGGDAVTVDNVNAQSSGNALVVKSGGTALAHIDSNGSLRVGMSQPNGLAVNTGGNTVGIQTTTSSRGATAAIVLQGAPSASAGPSVIIDTQSQTMSSGTILAVQNNGSPVLTISYAGHIIPTTSAPTVSTYGTPWGAYSSPTIAGSDTCFSVQFKSGTGAQCTANSTLLFTITLAKAYSSQAFAAFCNYAGTGSTPVAGGAPGTSGFYCVVTGTNTFNVYSTGTFTPGNTTFFTFFFMTLGAGAAS